MYDLERQFSALRERCTLLISSPESPASSPQTTSQALDALAEALSIAGKALDGCGALRRAYDETKEALRASQERFVSLLDAAPYGAHLYELQPDGSLIFVGANQSADKILGIDHAKLIGKTIEEAFPGLIGGPLPDIYRRVAASAEKYETEETVYGDERISGYFEVRACQLGPRRMVAFFRDLALLKWRETQLLKINRSLRTISECNQALVRATDEADLLNEICRIIVELGGYRMTWVAYAEQNAAKTVRAVAHAGDDSGFLDLLDLTWAGTELSDCPPVRSICTGQVSIITDIATDPSCVRWREEALRRGYASAISLPLLSPGAMPFGALSLFTAQPGNPSDDEIRLLNELAGDLAYGIQALRSLAERRRAESEREAALQALRESEALLQSFFDSPGTMSGIVEVVNGDVLHISGNRVGAAYFGRSVESMHNQTLSKMGMPLDAIQWLITRFEESRRTGQGVHGESSAHRGQWLAATLAFLGMSKDGCPRYSYALQDITERKRMEDQISRYAEELEQRVAERTAELSELAAGLRAANERLTELDRMKSQFVSNVSHELRTPLTNIKLYVQMIDEVRPEKRTGYIATLSREVNLLQWLIDDLLQLSHLDSGKASQDRQQIYLGSLVNQMVGDRAALAQTKGLTLQAEIDPHLPPVLGDPHMLLQVFSNLITNAMNYTPAGGSIEVRATTGRFGREGPDRREVALSVRDTGFGISPEEQEHLFQRFYRGDAARRSKAPGTGLGLAICAEIIKRHDGRITIDSRVGAGATFTVWLPVAETLNPSPIVE